ncbi:MAG: glycosyltransferase [bacterium]
MRITTHMTLENTEKFAAQFSRAWMDDCPFFLLIGTLAGAAAVRAAKQLHSDRERGLLVVEPVLSMLYAASFFHDLSSLISSTQIFWVTGPDVPKEIRRTVRERLLFAFSRCEVLIPPGEDAKNHSPYSQLAELTQSEQRIAAGLWTKEYLVFSSQRVPSQNTFRRVGSFVPRTQASWLLRVSVEAVTSGMRQASLDVTIVPEDAEAYQPPVKPLVDLMEANPDFLFSVNTPIRFMMQAPVWDAMRIPQVVWYVDIPDYWYRLGHWRSGTPPPSDVLLCYDRGDVDTVHSWGARHVAYLPTAADFIQPAEPQERFACDISFIASVFDQRNQYAGWPTPLKEYCDRLIEQIHQSYSEKRLRPPFFDGLFTEEALPGRSEIDLYALSKYIYLEVNNRLRLDAVRRLSDFDLIIYGPPYWQTLLGEKDAKRCYRGMIEYSTSARVMASSRVNLNVTSIQTGCSLGTRCFNVISQRGCLVTEWIEGLDHLFEPGEGVVYHHGLDELTEVIQRCLSDPVEREEIVERGRERVLREHTFKHRAQQIVAYLQDHKDSFFDE